MRARDESAELSVLAGFLPSLVGTGAGPSGRMKAHDHPAAPVDVPVDVSALTLAVHRGDAAAFGRFYDLYSFRVYRLVLVLARGDEPVAREVCQAVFIKVAKRLAVFADDRSLWAWVATLSRNAFIDHCRARRRSQRFVPLPDPPADFAAAERPRSPVAEALAEALAALPSAERELLQAAYIDERPLQELADASGQTYKAVECRLARLRLKLKEQLLKSLRHEPEP